MPTCECGAHVSERFAAVFGDRADGADVVYACPDCVGKVYLTRGAGADPAFAARVRGDE